MQIRVSDERPPVVTIGGEIIYTNSSRLRRALGELVGLGCPVSLDLSGVRFIDSSGIGVILEYAKALRKQGAELRLRRFSRYVYNTLLRLGLTEVLGVAETNIPGPSADCVAGESADRWLVSSFTVSINSTSPSVIRDRVGQLLADLPFAETESDDVRLAVGEAAANAIKYGCVDGGGAISVLCVADRDALTIEVSDAGPGFDRQAVRVPDFSDLPISGMGIAIMELAMDEVGFDSSGGTTVRMVKRFRR